MVSETSLLAFEYINQKGIRLNNRQKVMKVIYNKPGITLNEICKRLDKYPHQLSGRITELQECNAIHVSGRKVVDGRSYNQYKASVI